MRRRFGAGVVVAALLVTGAAGAADADLGGAEALYIHECSKCHGFLAGPVTGPRLGPRGVFKMVTVNERTSGFISQLAFSFPYGPSLAGIVGRRAGPVPNYQYSRSFMKYLGSAVWTRPALDAYLTDSQAMAPGIIMFYRQPDAKIRRKIIDYLARGG